MRHLDRIRTEPAIWLLILMAAVVAVTILYMVFTSITY